MFGYLGLFTAALVRPKHRNADLAAGLVTSLVAGLALFVVLFGPLGIFFQFDMRGDDIQLLEHAAFANADDGMRSLLHHYPDLSQVPAGRVPGSNQTKD